MRTRRTPSLICLYLTSRCNLACDFCLTAPRRAKAPAKDMTMRQVRRLVETFPCRRYKLSGSGEPTIASNIEPIARYLADNGKWIVVQTNGIRLPDLDLPWKRLAFVRISLNAPDAESYKTRCGRDAFDKVVRAVEFARSHCTRIGVTFVVGPSTVHRVADVVRLAVSLGVDRIGLPSETPYERTRDTKWWGDVEGMPEVLREQRSLVEKMSRLPTITWPHRPPRMDGWAPCQMAAEFLYLDGDGHQAPCCRGDGPRAQFGAGWRSKGMEAFRRAVNTPGAQQPPKCISCAQPDPRVVVP